MEILRGSVWNVDLGSTYKGSIQGNKRPCVVISNNYGNYYSKILLVVPITSSTTKHYLPTHSSIELTKPSIVLCEQIFTITKDDLISYVRDLTDEELEELNECLKISIGL